MICWPLVLSVDHHVSLTWLIKSVLSSSMSFVVFTSILQWALVYLAGSSKEGVICTPSKTTSLFRKNGAADSRPLVSSFIMLSYKCNRNINNLNAENKNWWLNTFGISMLIESKSCYFDDENQKLEKIIQNLVSIQLLNI